MENKLHTNQLYQEQHFIRYCTSDEGSVSNKIGVRISPAFLSACEKDGLIKPLHTEEQTEKKSDGTEVVNTVKFYSPFQIFLVSALCKNMIDEEGTLRTADPSWVDYQKEHKTRYIDWGDQSSFNVPSEKAGSTPPFGGVNHFTFAEDFHNFLQLLHSLEPLDYYKHYDPDKMRMNQNAPQLQYDLEPFRYDKEILSKYNLDIEKIKMILRHVGLYAQHIDPLEEWYYYIQKHPQRRRDELKGMASVAQDLYGFCNILTEIVEIVTDKKIAPLPEFIRADFPAGFKEKRAHLAGGEDIVAMQAAHKKLVDWIEQNKDFLKKITPLRGNEGLVHIADIAQKIGPELDDFYKRYGDVRYVGSYRVIRPSDKKITDLDPATKLYAEMFIKQREGRPLDSDDDTSDGEVLDFTGAEISSAIMTRLGDLSRKISDCIQRISNAMYPEEQRIETEKVRSVPRLQAEYFASDTGNENKSIKHILFYQDVLPKARKVYDDELKSIWALRTELGNISKATRIVFCAECRKNPVLLHQQHNDGKLSMEAICDECLSNASSDLKKMKSGSWKCDHCGKKIYQFAHGNALSDVLFNTVPATIKLDYGRMEIEVKCQNKKCGEKQTRIIDYGWLP